MCVKTLYVISGASRGFGRAVSAVCAEAAAAREEKAQFVLVARNRRGLDETTEAIHEQMPSANVMPVYADLMRREEHRESLVAAFTRLEGSYYERSLLLNNAGIVHPVQDFMMLREEDWWPSVSVSLLACHTISKYFIGVLSRSKTIVHVSSLAAEQALQGLTVYCTVKAAADALHRSLAAEHPEVRVLNYAPGPLLTAMLDEVVEHHPNARERAAWTTLKAKALDPHVSAQRLMQLLGRDDYENGAHIDYYDLSPEGESVAS